MKRILLCYLLPFLLAAGILAAGILVPDYLLDRGEESYTKTVSAVPVADVRPYGDDYDDMKNSLLSTVRLVAGDSFVSGELADSAELYESCDLDRPEDLALAEERACLFLETWGGKLGSDWLDGLFSPSYDYILRLVSEDGDDWALQMEGVFDRDDGASSALVASPESGALVSCSVAVCLWEYISPQDLWDSLLETYQERCGLDFIDSPAEATDFNEEQFQAVLWDVVQYQEAIGEAETPYIDVDDGNISMDRAAEAGCNFSTLSSDLTFRLTMSVTAYDEYEWVITVELTENDLD